MLVRDYLENNARSWPTRSAYVSESGRFSWRETADRSRRLAAAFQAFGIKKGDVVASLAYDRQEVVEIWYACALIGAVRVGINPRYSPREMGHILNDARVSLLVVHVACRSSFDALEAETPTLTTVVGAGEGHGLEIDYDRLMAETGPLEVLPPLGPDDDIAISYTTGSTGLPKGARWSQSSVVAAELNTWLQAGLRRDDVFLHCLPAAGVPVLLATFNVFNGSTVVLMERFSARGALDLIESERVSCLLWVPTMIVDVLADPELDRFDLSSLRLVIYGSAPATPALVRKAIDRFGCEMQQWYGSTEGAAGWYSILDHEDHLAALAGRVELLSSCGRATLHCQVSILDEEGRDLPPGEVGEICVRSDTLMTGYVGLPTETTDALRDGRLHTGDLGRIDEDGYLYVVDRKKFMIITGGYNVYPIVVENVLAEHPSVREVCVVGVPAERWGEAVCAVVVVTDDIGEDELIEFCRGRLAKFEIPKQIKFVSALPRGATGKVLKTAVRDEFLHMVPSPDA